MDQLIDFRLLLPTGFETAMENLLIEQIVSFLPASSQLRCKTRGPWLCFPGFRHKELITPMKGFIALAALVFLPFSVVADERGERDAIAEKVSGLFLSRDFQGLEEVATAYRAGSERTSAGMWKIRKFYGGIEDTVPKKDPDHENWSAAIEIIDEWLAAHPDSPTPYIAKAHILMHRAWAYRGTGYASTVEPGDAIQLKLHAAHSKGVLMQSKRIASQDPEYYSILASIDLALGSGEREYRKSLDEGLDRYPQYDELYFRGARFYSPKWYGSEEALAAFAAEAVERTKNERGHELYARIYWAAGRDPDGIHYFRKPAANWPLMRSGIKDLVGRFPDQWNINHLAFYSCLMRDLTLAGELIPMIEEPVLESAWYRRSNLEICRRKIRDQESALRNLPNRVKANSSINR